MYLLRIIFILALSVISSFAESQDNNASYIDETHSGISQKIIEWSYSLDETINGWLQHKDCNCTILNAKKHKYI